MGTFLSQDRIPHKFSPKRHLFDNIKVKNQCGGVGCASPSPARQTPPPVRVPCFPDGKCRTSDTGSGSNMLWELSETLSSLMKPSSGFPLGAPEQHSQQAGSRQGESGGPQRNLVTEPLGTDEQQCSVRCTQCLPTRWD